MPCSHYTDEEVIVEKDFFMILLLGFLFVIFFYFFLCTLPFGTCACKYIYCNFRLYESCSQLGARYVSKINYRNLNTR